MSGNMRVKATINNYTTKELIVKSEKIEWGKWTQTPVNCKANATTKYAFKAQGASGSATGVEGDVIYRVGDGSDSPELTIKFSVPFIGSNTFKANVNSSKYVVTLSGTAMGSRNSIVIDLNNKLSK
jgi:hypothetical protein